MATNSRPYKSANANGLIGLIEMVTLCNRAFGAKPTPDQAAFLAFARMANLRVDGSDDKDAGYAYGGHYEDPRYRRQYVDCGQRCVILDMPAGNDLLLTVHVPLSRVPGKKCPVWWSEVKEGKIAQLLDRMKRGG